MVGKSSGEGRTIVEGVLGLALALLETLLESVDILPEREDLVNRSIESISRYLRLLSSSRHGGKWRRGERDAPSPPQRRT